MNPPTLLLCRPLLTLLIETARVGTKAPGTPHRHKILLEGVHNLADVLLEDGRNSGMPEHYLSEVRLICEFAKEGLVEVRPLESAFQHVLDAAERAEFRCPVDSEEQTDV
jgi:hypothetical protein